MPYIEQKDRTTYDKFIEQLANELHNKYKGNTDFIPGHLNYIVFKLIKTLYKKLIADINFPLRYGYSEMNKIVGFLEACKLEYYRRVISTYEDSVISKNGDVD